MFLSNQPKFFGRRQGRRIRKAKTALLESFLPQLKIGKQTVFTAKGLFASPVEKIYLEIGFGNGEHLAAQSAKHPEIGFIGAEVFKNGIANLLSLVTGVKEGDEIPETISLLPERRHNLRLFDDDVRLLFPQLPDNFIDRVYVLFPDPWPKKRHASRRFVNPDNLREIHRILKPGGLLRIATDHPVYKSWTLRRLHDFDGFTWTAKTSDDWRYPPTDWVETKYQRKALREGRRPVFLDYRKDA